MRAFAKASAALASNEPALGRLVAAVQRENVEEFSALVKELRLERFCLQICHWICGLICQRFCHCVCPPPFTIPLFTHVGQYRVDPIFNDFTADGTTTAGDQAFTQTIPLRGILPDGTAPLALEYRFRTEKYPLPSGVQDVTAGMIGKTVIGELEYFEWDGAKWVLRSTDYFVSDPANTQVTIKQQFGPPLLIPVNKPVKLGGWIEVPRENQLFPGGVGRFVPTGGLANLITTTLTDEKFDLTVNAPPLPLKAGDSVPGPQQSEKPHYKIYFEARQVFNQAAVSANEREKIALSNTTYKYTRHPNWDGGAHTDTPVLSVDAVELLANGCQQLGQDLHVTFTAYHPYLGTCSVYLDGPLPLPPAVSPPISVNGEAKSPMGGQPFNITGLKPCAYIVWLTATLRLTSGYGAVFGTFEDHIAFCKK
jgi:hypothetical protein